jgi:hypothetical protein
MPDERLIASPLPRFFRLPPTIIPAHRAEMKGTHPSPIRPKQTLSLGGRPHYRNPPFPCQARGGEAGRDGNGSATPVCSYSSCNGCRIQDAYPVCGFFEDRCQVPGTRYRVPAIWHLGPGTRHRSRIDAEGRIPSTEDRAQRAHRICRMQDRNGPDSDYRVPGTRYLAPPHHSHRGGTHLKTLQAMRGCIWGLGTV